MTRSMLFWQIDKVIKMQDMEAEILDGIADSLDYIEKHPEKKLSEDELIFIRKMLEASANNLRLYGELEDFWKKYLKDNKAFDILEEG